MNIIAPFFRFIFKCRFFKKYFYLIRKRIFIPFGLFRGKTALCRYYEDLKIKLNLDEWIQQHIYFLGSWDKPGINFMKNNLKKDDIFIDIGANIGSYTLIASKIIGDKGKVFAFEPYSLVFKRLKENIELNNISNIEAINKAVIDNPGIIQLHISPNDNMGMSSIYRHDSESGIIEDVEAVCLDKYSEQKLSGLIRMIKIDAEGAELDALRGMKNLIKISNPIMLIEMSEDVLSRTSYTSQDIIDFMRDLNYKQRGIDKKGEMTDPAKAGNYSNFVFIPDIRSADLLPEGKQI